MGNKVRVIHLKVDKADYDAIQEAVAIRGSGLFRLPGCELFLPDRDGESDRKAKLLAEICRQWVEELGEDTIQAVLEKQGRNVLGVGRVSVPLLPASECPSPSPGYRSYPSDQPRSFEQIAENNSAAAESMPHFHPAAKSLHQVMAEPDTPPPELPPMVIKPAKPRPDPNKPLP